VPLAAEAIGPSGPGDPHDNMPPVLARPNVQNWVVQSHLLS
jgi:microcystin-dependent protein